MTDSHWPQITNFRDVGGYAGADGRLVKRGLLYRGTGLYNATDADLAAMAGLGIGLVFDLRCLDEVAGRPDRLPPGAAYRREPGVISMDEMHKELLDWQVLIDEISQSEQALAQMETFQYGVYDEMARYPAAFGALLGELLAEPDRPVYIHCSAGKDRTGMACAIILRLLGVGRADSLADYLKSGESPLPEYAAVLAAAKKRGPRVGKLIGTMLTVSLAQFDSAFDSIDQAWGSWDGFVRDGLNLTSDDVSALKSAYLQPDDPLS